MEARRWKRYRHKNNPDIEYDVEVSLGDGLTFTRRNPVNGELCFRIRTIRNLANSEEVHQPAYTIMPAEKFFEVYERVGSGERKGTV